MTTAQSTLQSTLPASSPAPLPSSLHTTASVRQAASALVNAVRREGPGESSTL